MFRRSVALLGLAAATLAGCKQEFASSRSEARDARRTGRANANRAQASRLGQGGMQGSQPAKDSTPFTMMRGYVVRGTDEYSFRPCGSAKVYLVRGLWDVQGKLTQQYRFRAPGMLTPVYFVVRSRFLVDTVVAGENTYLGVAEISRIYDESRSEAPRCKPPMRGSLLSTR